jgi:hypothetical protein
MSYQEALQELQKKLPPEMKLHVDKSILDGSAFEPKVVRFEPVSHGYGKLSPGYITPMWVYLRKDKHRFVPHFPSWWTKFWLWLRGWELVQSWREAE